jgi:hypothetical protein
MILEYRTNEGRWDEVPGAITREYLSDTFGFDHGDRFESPELITSSNLPIRAATGGSITMPQSRLRKR